MNRSESWKPFPEAVRDLMLENPALMRKNRNANYMALAKLSSLDYETLRKAIAGDRQPSMKVMQAVARALNVLSDYFFEWRLEKARESFDPNVVGLETALRNLDKFRQAKAESAGASLVSGSDGG